MRALLVKQLQEPRLPSLRGAVVILGVALQPAQRAQRSHGRLFLSVRLAACCFSSLIRTSLDEQTHCFTATHPSTTGDVGGGAWRSASSTSSAASSSSSSSSSSSNSSLSSCCCCCCRCSASPTAPGCAGPSMALPPAGCRETALPSAPDADPRCVRGRAIGAATLQRPRLALGTAAAPCPSWITAGARRRVGTEPLTIICARNGCVWCDGCAVLMRRRMRGAQMRR